MTDSLRFYWTVAYLSCETYVVHGDGPPYEIELRLAVTPYERSISRLDESTWQRDVVASVGLLHCRDTRKAPSRDLVEAFNRWRAEEHARLVELIRRNRPTDRPLPDDDPVLIPPPEVRGGRYEIGTGWIENPKE
jgi:hypothetical protein